MSTSLAAPQIAGLVALILSEYHAGLKPFHVKMILAACAAHVR